jgi:hypothetical protein
MHGAVPPPFLGLNVMVLQNSRDISTLTLHTHDFTTAPETKDESIQIRQSQSPVQ